MRDIEIRRLRVREDKAAKERLIPITTELVADLVQLIGRCETGPPYLSLRSLAISIRPLNWIVAN